MSKPTDNQAKPLLFKGEAITDEAAAKALAAVYGDKRTPEILAGLQTGVYKCASVAGGYLTIKKD